MVLGLLITVNPDLTAERKAFVTPVVKFVLRPLRGWRGLSAATTEGGEGENGGSSEVISKWRRRKRE